MEVLNLKSSETKEYNSENEAEKKGIADSIYLNKNADTGLAAPLLEPSPNEGVMLSEDSNKEEPKYVVIDIVQQSHEEEADPIIRCCSCFSFFFPSGSCFNLFRIFGKKHEEDSQMSSLAQESWSPNSGWIIDGDYLETTPNSCGYAPRPSKSESFGDHLIIGFKPPVKRTDLPR